MEYIKKYIFIDKNIKNLLLTYIVEPIKSFYAIVYKINIILFNDYYQFIKLCFFKNI